MGLCLLKTSSAALYASENRNRLVSTDGLIAHVCGYRSASAALASSSPAATRRKVVALLRCCGSRCTKPPPTRNGAEHCRLFDPKPHAPDWPSPPQSHHSPRTDSLWPCEQSASRLLPPAEAGLASDVLSSHRTCARPAFGTM